MQNKTDRSALQAEVSRHHAELSDLPKLDRSQWPEPVVQVVEAHVHEAVAAAVEELQKETAQSMAQMEAECSAATASCADAEQGRAAAEARAAAGAQRLEAHEEEGRQQVAVLQAEIGRLEGQVTALQAAERPAEDAARLRRSEAAAVARAAELETALEAATADLAAAAVRADPAAAAEALDEQAASAEALDEPTAAAPGGVSDAAAAGTDARSDGYWQGCYAEAQARVAALDAELAAAQAELADERHAHELRSLADSARRAEISELQAQKGRSTVDVEYLKNALLGFFESGELPASAQVLLVLETLLCFTDKDKERLARVQARGTGGPRTPAKPRSGFALFG